MNQWIQKQIRLRLQRVATGNLQLTRSMHFIPQHHYVYDDVGSQIVRHVLHYETLQLDFHNLMDSYNLTIQLPDKSRHGVNKARISAAKKLTAANMTASTIALINDYYLEDFQRFGYAQRDPSSGQQVEKA
jgi:hypothetical protein